MNFAILVSVSRFTFTNGIGMADKYQLVARGSLWGGGDTTIRSHLGLLASKSGKRAIRHLLSLHPIHVVAITKAEEGKIKSWYVVAGERTYQLARGVIPADEKIPVVVLSDTDDELSLIDEIVSVLMFSDPPDAFWTAWDRCRMSGDIQNLGRDLDDIEEIEQILGRKRKRKTKKGTLPSLDTNGMAENPPKIDLPPGMGS